MTLAIDLTNQPNGFYFLTNTSGNKRYGKLSEGRWGPWGISSTTVLKRDWRKSGGERMTASVKLLIPEEMM